MNDGGFFFDVCQESLCYLIAYFLTDLPSVVLLLLYFSFRFFFLRFFFILSSFKINMTCMKKAQSEFVHLSLDESMYRNGVISCALYRRASADSSIQPKTTFTVIFGFKNVGGKNVVYYSLMLDLHRWSYGGGIAQWSE